jgi:hypothetical protein
LQISAPRSGIRLKPRKCRHPQADKGNSGKRGSQEEAPRSGGNAQIHPAVKGLGRTTALSPTRRAVDDPRIGRDDLAEARGWERCGNSAESGARRGDNRDSIRSIDRPFPRSAR